MAVCLGAAVGIVAGIAVGLAAPDRAAAATSATGGQGQKLTVSRSSGLKPAGETVTVSGSGYDVEKGIYVAFCVDTGAGHLPTPCGGGADTTGSSGASSWISSNPPAYGAGLAIPYGPGGSFRVTLRVTATIGSVDCRVTRCAVVTRADHTRTDDRSQDVRIPVTFAGGSAATPTTRSGTGGAAAPAPTARPAAGASADPSGTAAPPPSTSAGPAHPDDLAVTQVSSSRSASRWWTGTAALLVLAGLGIALTVRRRRRGGTR
ncbi:MAG TPA: hypothetical protein VHA75_00970 [Rugosimonospora sp.]|nr:hypothetical protein [Rugosimonospora sp.]